MALAVNTVGVVQNKTLYELADITATTAKKYDQLLRNMLVLDAIPAWSSNRLTRLIDTPKRFLADPSLMASLLDLTVETVLADGNMLGRLIETFVMAQLPPEISVTSAGSVIPSASVSSAACCFIPAPPPPALMTGSSQHPSVPSGYEQERPCGVRAMPLGEIGGLSRPSCGPTSPRPRSCRR